MKPIILGEFHWREQKLYGKRNHLYLSWNNGMENKGGNMYKAEEEKEEIGKKEDRYGEEFYFKILNKNRYILLYDEINNMSADIVCSKLRAMDMLNHKPIYLEINSPGGSVADGMSMINTMEHVQSPVITIISGQVCSMAALISICGDYRMIYSNSYFMQHSTSDIVGDYINYIKDRTKFLCEFEHRTEKILKLKTKLSNNDIIKIRTGELWLSADQCLAKGVVDKIISFKPKKFKKIQL
jgi:ATP-dependent Clp protease protease subunit